MPGPNDYEKQKKWNWRNSWAKEILREAIMVGDIKEEHTYDEIYQWHPEITFTDRAKLPARVRALRAQVTGDTSSAESDALALEHDRKLYPIPSHNYRGEPRWDGSDAQRMLKADIVAGVHLSMTPVQFYVSRPVYEAYSSDVIRQHIYQEVKYQKYCLYRNDKNKSKYVRFIT